MVIQNWKKHLNIYLSSFLLIMHYILKTKYLRRISESVILLITASLLINIGVLLILGYVSIFQIILCGISGILLIALIDLENKNFDENRPRYVIYILVEAVILLLSLLYIIWLEIEGIYPFDIDVILFF